LIEALVEMEDMAEKRRPKRVDRVRGEDMRVLKRDQVGPDLVLNRKAGQVRAADRNRIQVSGRGKGVTKRELILLRRAQVHPPAALGGIILGDDRRGVHRWRGVAGRIELGDAEPERAQQRRRDDLVGKRRAAARQVDERRQAPAEVSSALGGSRNTAGTRDPLAVDEPLPVQEKEGPVAPKRAAGSSAELVLLERLDIARKKVARVEDVVAEELVQRTVKFVAPGFGDDTGEGAGRAAAFGRRGMRQNAKLRDGIDGDAQRIAAIHPVQVSGAVEQIKVGFRTLAVDDVRLARPQGAAGAGDAGGERRHACLQEPQLGEVAAV
jgi:hypothetical protein